MGSVLSRLVIPSWGSPLGESESAEIRRHVVAGQSFQAPMAGLSAVEVRARALNPATSQVVTLRLFEGADGRPLAEKAIELVPGMSTTTLRLEFSPVGSSQGKTIRFTVESDAAPGQGITVPYSPHSTTVGSAASINGQPIPGSLQFQTHYAPTVWQKAELVVAKLLDAVGNVRGGRGALIAGAFLYGGVLGLFVLQATRAGAAEARDG